MENENENRENYYDEYEIDLREYILLLWDNKLFIAGLVILAIIGSFLYSSFMVEKLYEAKSTLLILPPRYTTSLEVESFSVETYRNLATTDSIKQTIIKKLDLKDDEGNFYSVNRLEKMMTLEVLTTDEEITDNGKNSAPLIELRVQNKDPELASEIANIWAQNFISDSKEIRQNEVREIATVIQEQFNDTERKLNRLKSNLLSFNKENRLELLRQSLNNKFNKLNSYNKHIIDLETKLGAKNTEYDNLKFQIRNMEKNDVWIGEFNNNNYNKKEYDLLKIKDRYSKAQNKLLRFNQKNDLSLLSEKINLARNNIISYEKNIDNINNQLVNLKESNMKLSIIIDKENKKWTLNRSIDNNTLWNNILSEKEISILEDLQLQTETINPVYQQARKEFSSNSVIISKIPALLKYYNKEIEHEKNKLHKLNDNYYNLQLEKNNLNQNLDNYKKSYTSYVNKYQKLLNRKLDLKLEIENLKKQLLYYQNIEEELTTKIKNMQSRLWEGTNKKEIINQKISDVQNTYNLLAKRVEEARISEAQRTSDVKFYSEAVTPSIPISNNTALNIAISSILALMLAIFIIFFREFMKQKN